MGTLLLVHAHPDDECVATGGVMIRAGDHGHRVVLVTATRGEEGEIHNMDVATSRPRLGEIRTEELRRAGEILGVHRQAFLEYRDSGMAGTATNHDPRSFHMAPLAEAAKRLAVIMREERPDVVVTYTPDGTYGHPDHIKAHHTTIAALDLLAGEGWSPAKAYLHAVPRSFVTEVRERMREMGREEDANAFRIAGIPDEEITTIVDVRDLVARKRASFAAHVSQNDPNSPFATMAEQMFVAAFGHEQFVLERGALGEPHPEHDLFVGV
jgi:N-acetyl-1-D-myo-inositol-2-amino-2-deoxy-alpha-D-glucopyranoside deacetylase